MARFFGKPSINDHLDDLIGSWFGKVPTPPVNDHGSKPNSDHGPKPHNDGPDDTPPYHHDGPDFPPIKDLIKFWLHKVFGGHHHIRRQTAMTRRRSSTRSRPARSPRATAPRR